MRGSWRPNMTEIFWLPLLWLSTLCHSCSPDAGVHSAGCWLLYCILSASSLDPNSSGPQAPSAWCGFPYHIPSPTQLAWLLSCLSYIIVQRPLDHPRDLWNRMFNHHPVEITVMQVRGHSLPVRQSMRVSWDFFFTSSHFISQFLPMRFPLIIAIRMCHFLPVHHLGMAFLAGSKGQNITVLSHLIFVNAVWLPWY